jgi:NAD(P)-dependent dehydrogenase (short-subunit alcohol dehydrogenase family)
MMAQKSGSIILMASARALTGGRTQAAYSASKAGILGMMRCLVHYQAAFFDLDRTAFAGLGGETRCG